MSAPGYRSTRRRSPTVPFGEALLAGLAPDGGLYLPERILPLPADWEGVETPGELAVKVLGPYLGPGGTPPGLFEEALDFPLPVVPLSRDRYLLELFHGPTLAFKDLGARTMARLMSRVLEWDQRVTVLVATSGDTGSAVAAAFAGLPQFEVVLLYPKGMVSELQERQLITARPGVRTFAVGGTFDDCQRLVKRAFAEPRLSRRRLTSANSINIGRLLPQALYYLWAALQVARLRGGEWGELVVSVPSGNLGNLTGGILALQMGLPVRRFVAAHNRNDFFPEFLWGVRPAFDFKSTVTTPSNAMDVGAPSNFERLHALLAAGLAERISGQSVDDATTLERIRITAEEEGYLACPHTAVGLEAVERYRGRSCDAAPTLVLATAHPAKFPDVMERALGRPPPRSAALERLRDAPTRVEPLVPSIDALVEALG